MPTIPGYNLSSAYLENSTLRTYIQRGTKKVGNKKIIIKNDAQNNKLRTNTNIQINTDAKRKKNVHEQPELLMSVYKSGLFDKIYTPA